jgi:hypothetical protein
MKFIYLFLVCLFVDSCKSATNEVELSIMPETMSLSNDTLQFKYRITNNTAKDLVFYNSRLLSFDNPVLNLQRLKNGISGVLITIVDQNNKMSKYFRARTDPWNQLNFKPDRYDKYDIYDTYIVLKHNESIIHTAKESLWPINLQKGSYKLQITYFSYNYYEAAYSKIKEKNSKLKNTILFKGSLKSNIHNIEYPTFQYGMNLK